MISGIYIFDVYLIKIILIATGRKATFFIDRLIKYVYTSSIIKQRRLNDKNNYFFRVYIHIRNYCSNLFKIILDRLI